MINILTILGVRPQLIKAGSVSREISNSRGLQKEVYFFEKQCITLRDETEWVELLKCGANLLVGANKEQILKAYKNHSTFNIKNSKLDLYGGGQASENIIKEILNFE